MSDRDFDAPEWAIALLLEQAQRSGVSIDGLLQNVRSALLDSSKASLVSDSGLPERLQILERIEGGYTRFSTEFGNG